jgi:hypothetical protein
MKNILTLTLISALLLGCVSTTGMSLKEKDDAYAKFVLDEKLVSKDKVNGYQFKGWKSLSNNFLILTAVHKKDYLIETKGMCFDLHKAHGIKLNRSSNWAIYKLGDSISPVGLSSVNEIIDKCYIKSIYPMTNVQTDNLVNIGKPVQNES